MARVLVVDDEPQILRAMRISLRVRGYEVDTAATGKQALEMAAQHPPDLVILDLGLPDLDGVEVIGGLRGWSTAPIIVLSGRAESTDKVEALDAGADDYVTKPFGMDELLARMRAAVRRAGPPDASPQVRLGDLLVELAAKRVTRPDGTDIRLTPTEWHLLEYLLRHPGKLLSQRQLLAEVWGARLCGRDREPAPVHDATAPQAGTRPGAAALAAHRTRHGLPVPARPGTRGLRRGPAAPRSFPLAAQIIRSAHGQAEGQPLLDRANDGTARP